MSLLHAVGSGGSGDSGSKLYVEDVFSTYLYTGNGSTQTINNGIDLAGEGGMVWIKSRTNAKEHVLTDTVRGTGLKLMTNLTYAQVTTSESVSAFNANGFSINTPGSAVNGAYPYVSWTFRKAPKFFDIVKYTGNGADCREIAHELGVAPGMIVVKRTDSTSSWPVWHRSSMFENARLNTTSAVESGGLYVYGGTSKTTFKARNSAGCSDSTSFTNLYGATYVAYLFAHDPLGENGDDGMIACGSFTTDGSGGATVELGWEPQYLMVKRTSGAEGWSVLDSMRGFSAAGGKGLAPNSATEEYERGSTTAPLKPTAIGLESVMALSASSTYIYMAIRRPMKVPTSSDEVFAIDQNTLDGAPFFTSGFATDMAIYTSASGGGNRRIYSRLTQTLALFTGTTPRL